MDAADLIEKEVTLCDVLFHATTFATCKFRQKDPAHAFSMASFECYEEFKNKRETAG